MKSKRKALLLAFSAILLVAASVLGTYAFLTAQSQKVENTFTVGKVAITLDEAKVTAMGVVDGSERVQANSYKLIPGHSYVKDPTVHITAGSENSWLFVRVNNGLSAIEKAGDTTIAKQMEKLGWTAVAPGSDIYAYQSTVTADANIKVFEQFIVDGTKTGTDLTAYPSAKITVEAYAVQADGFDNAAAALTAAPFPAPFPAP